MKNPARIAFFLAAAWLCAPASAQLFKCTAADGKVGYQDAPCTAGASEKKLPSIHGDSAGAGPAGVSLIDVEAAAKRVAQRGAGGTVLVLYSSKCGTCQQVMPQLTELARQYQGRSVDWQVFSTDAPEDVAGVPAFLAESQAPFAPVAIRPWPADAITRAFAPLGLSVGARFQRPFMAVLGRSGKVLMQGEGVSDAALVRGAIDAAAAN